MAAAAQKKSGPDGSLDGGLRRWMGEWGMAGGVVVHWGGFWMSDWAGRTSVCKPEVGMIWPERWLRARLYIFRVGQLCATRQRFFFFCRGIHCVGGGGRRGTR